MFKTVVIILDVIAMIIALSFSFSFYHDPHMDIADSIAPISVALLFVLNILAIIFGNKPWSSLYFERKRLEEQKRINELKSEISKQAP